MGYTAPTSRSTGELITASIWNTDIVDNLEALKDPPTTAVSPGSGANFSTTSTSFTDVDATISLDITPVGTEIFLFISASVSHGSASAQVAFDVTKNGSSITSLTNGIGSIVLGAATSAPGSVTRILRITGLTAGAAVNFKLQWRVITAGTLSLLNTTSLHYFVARELS